MIILNSLGKIEIKEYEKKLKNRKYKNFSTLTVSGIPYGTRHGYTEIVEIKMIVNKESFDTLSEITSVPFEVSGMDYLNSRIETTLKSGLKIENSNQTNKEYLISMELEQYIKL